jgi:hypothetical protein
MMTPFTQGKYEHSTQHLYFLDSTIAGDLESTRPIVLIGSRGSGKTTLLRALDIRERRANDSLRHQLDGNSFRGNFIGCYAKLSLHACSALESLYGKGTPVEGRLFGFYLDALSVHLVSGALSELISHGVLASSTSLRENDVGAIFNEIWSDILQWLNCDPCNTLRDISAVSLKAMHALQRSADRGVTAQGIADDFRIPAFGEYSRSTLQHIVSFCNQATVPAGAPRGQIGPSWHFKICLDEVESLSESHRLVVNTLIRVAESPLFPVISYVSQPFDMTSTLLPNLTLQKADFLRIQLDEATNDDFARLAEGVATVRCRAILKDNSVSFTCRTTLGVLSLNTLVEGIRRTSEKQIASSLKINAEAFKEAWFPDGTNKAADPLPYVESFIAAQDKLTPPAPGTSKDARKQSSEQFRKKMVVAYLSICRTLGRSKVPFAYDAMILGISDKCIRDFLSQLHWVLAEAFPSATEVDLRKFLTKQVSLTKQYAGIRKASEEKHNSISGTSGVLRPVIIRRIVEGFARITSLLQSQVSKDGAGLSEMGIFEVDGGSEKDRFEASRLILDGAEAGFLRIVADGTPLNPLAGFRVHRSLAPAFNFSYRGPYYSKKVRISEFNDVANSTDESKIGPLAERIAIRLLSHRDMQGTLFSMDEVEKEDV